MSLACLDRSQNVLENVKSSLDSVCICIVRCKIRFIDVEIVQMFEWQAKLS